MNWPLTPAATTRLSRFGYEQLSGAVALLPGVALSTAIALASLYLCRYPVLHASGVSALVLAMVLGIGLGNVAHGKIFHACSPGIALSKQRLLRLGIILYGTRLTFHDIGLVGLSGVVIDALVLLSTFGLALLVGSFLMKLDQTTVLLIGAGSSICGAAAVLATDPVVKARTEQVTVAVSTVVIFGTLATFLYPVLHQLSGHWRMLPGSNQAFGLYAGSTIHEVAQVVAAARSIDVGAVDIAVIAKMVRVMMLCPFLLCLALYLALAPQAGSTAENSGRRRRIGAALILRSTPWFALWFLAMIALNSALALPADLIDGAKRIDTLLLLMAMAALGLTTHVSAFKLAGVKPILLAAILFAWLVLGGAWINHLVPRML